MTTFSYSVNLNYEESQLIAKTCLLITGSLEQAMKDPVLKPYAYFSLATKDTSEVVNFNDSEISAISKLLENFIANADPIENQNDLILANQLKDKLFLDTRQTSGNNFNLLK